eukprot:1194039-Prorocentrum_minimum.AAC.2
MRGGYRLPKRLCPVVRKLVAQHIQCRTDGRHLRVVDAILGDAILGDALPVGGLPSGQPRGAPAPEGVQRLFSWGQEEVQKGLYRGDPKG